MTGLPRGRTVRPVRRNPQGSEGARTQSSGASMQNVGRFIGRKYKAAKDPLGAITAQRSGVEVKHWYSGRSRVMASTDVMKAVKLADGTKGWMDILRNKFVSEDDIRRMLYSLDKTQMGLVEGISLLDIYDNLTVQQKAEFAEVYRKVDWDVFWEENYQEELDFDRKMDAYENLLLMFGTIAGWQA